MSDDILGWLQAWYAAQCDGDWEHDCGVNIATLDNPGWSVEIDLKEALSPDSTLIEGKRDDSETDWLRYEVRDGRFIGFGGPLNLSELLQIFRAGVTKQ
jgi:hypothetical protein